MGITVLLWEANEAWWEATAMCRCDVEPYELHALGLQLIPGSKVEPGDGFFSSLSQEVEQAVVC